MKMRNNNEMDVNGVMAALRGVPRVTRVDGESEDSYRLRCNESYLASVDRARLGINAKCGV